MTGESLNRGPKRPLHEAVKLKPELFWRQDVADAGVLGCLPRRAAHGGDADASVFRCTMWGLGPSSDHQAWWQALGPLICFLISEIPQKCECISCKILSVLNS